MQKSKAVRVYSKSGQDFKNTWSQREWESALSQYERSKKALELSKRLNHEYIIQYWQENIDRLEKKYGKLLTQGF